LSSSYRSIVAGLFHHSLVNVRVKPPLTRGCCNSAMPLPHTSPLVSHPTRPFWIAAAAGLVATLLWDAGQLDLAVMKWLGDASGFPLRHQWGLELVLHDAARQVATVGFVGLLAMVLVPWGPFRRLSARQRLETWTGTGMGLLLVNAIKRDSLTSCPWDLELFGGTAQYVSHWALWLTDGGPGRCFPGGHASAGLAFVALALPLLASEQARTRRTGQQVLLAVVGMGLLLGGTQTLRGAHYPSHTLWSAWFCWVAAVTNHELFTRFSRWHAVPAGIRRP
jgi:membrane-associated PAP2 superfamily phosphatase